MDFATIFALVKRAVSFDGRDGYDLLLNESPQPGMGGTHGKALFVRIASGRGSGGLAARSFGREPRRDRRQRGSRGARNGHQLHGHRHQLPRSGSRPGPTAPCGSPTHGNELDRADHHDRDGHQLHRHRHQRPVRDRGRTRRRHVVHQLGNNSIGRITTTGTVTNYTGTGISSPYGIAAGPDGAMWFTNNGNSIGRITTTGTVTNYTGTGISAPRDRGRARRRPVVHQRQRLDRADQHDRHGHQLHRHRHQQPGRDRGRARRRPVVHQPGNNSIGRISTTGTVTNYTGTGISKPVRDRGRARRRPLVHQLRQLFDRADQHDRHGHQLHRHGHQRSGRDRGRARRGHVVHQQRQQLDRADRTGGADAGGHARWRRRW